MKKAALTVVAILLAVLLTSAFTLSAVLTQPKSPATGEDVPEDSGVQQDSGEDEPAPVEPAPPEEAPEEAEDPAEPDAAADASAILERLGIMNGVGKLEDGSADYALDKTLTRAEAMTFIARAVGYEHDGADVDYPHTFRDVPDWASGSVGFAFLDGITTGENPVAFTPDREVTGRELATFALRALGYGGDFDWQEACAFSDGLGLTDGELGDGQEAITRGQTAQVIVSMLKLTPKDREKTLLGRLLEMGFVDRGTLEELELDEYTGTASEGGLTAAQALRGYGGAVVTVKTRDIMQKAMTTAHGSIVAKDTVAVPLSAVRGASYLELTDTAGADMGYRGVVGYDEALGLCYLGCTAEAPEFLAEPEPAPDAGEDTPDVGEDAPDSGEADAGEEAKPGDSGTVEPDAEDPEPMVYVVSDMAVPGGDTGVTSELALPVARAGSGFLGFTTAKGPMALEITEGEPRQLYDVGLELWPEQCPPMRPRGIDPAKPMTAITYDDGPSKTYTPLLLDLLEKYNTVATFFEVGTCVKAHPEFLTRMEAMGCEIGNHSWDHTTLTKLSAQGVRNQIKNTEDLITSYTGHDVKIVRCPGGGSNSTVAANVGHPIIYWTIDTRDWEHKNASRVISSVQNDRNLDGDIILMHSLYKSTYEASLTLIPWIIEKGYQPVTVSELAYFRGVQLQNGVTYVKFPPN